MNCIVENKDKKLAKCHQVDVWGVPYKIVTKKINSPTVLSTFKKKDRTRARKPFRKMNSKMTRLPVAMVEWFTKGGASSPIEAEEIRIS